MSIKKLVDSIQTIYGTDPIPLHRPVFEGNEKQYLLDCIDSNFVSSVGARVTEFEQRLADFSGTKYGVATVNGTAALHTALIIAGVKNGDEVISQALTFVATCNAISYTGATPVFVDVDRDTLGMSPSALRMWLQKNAVQSVDGARNRITGARIVSCVPMHTFGIPCRIQQIAEICSEWGITLIEDTAESLGSYVETAEGWRHTGSFGNAAAFSFNGNKIITTGGGGMLVTNCDLLAKRAKHLTTTAKVAHPYEFTHDQIGYNYRMPNLNAALGCAQMEKLDVLLTIKAGIANSYRNFCHMHGVVFLDGPLGTRPNYWLNAILLDSRQQRDEFLKYTNAKGVMTRPIWRLMSSLDMFKECQHDGLENSRWLEDRVVNLPSSVPESEFWRIRK